MGAGEDAAAAASAGSALVAEQLSAATLSITFACCTPAALADVTQLARCFSSILAADAV